MFQPLSMKDVDLKIAAKCVEDWVWNWCDDGAICFSLSLECDFPRNFTENGHYVVIFQPFSMKDIEL